MFLLPGRNSPDTYPTLVIDNLELLSLLGRDPSSLKN